MKKVVDNKVKVSHKFVNALAIVSMLGFAGIVSYTLFEYDLNNFVEAMLMIVIGLGLIMESKLSTFKVIKESGLNSNNFTHLTTVVIGFIALVAGIFSMPYIRIETPAFLAVKGIISVIAIIFIIIQTWFIE